MLKILIGVFITLLAFYYISVNTQPHQVEAKNPTKADLAKFLDGKLYAWGVLYDWKGAEVDSFIIEMQGKIEGKTGVVDEVFLYGDGRKSTRTWTLKFAENGSVTGTAPDVEGEMHATQSGSIAKLRYTLMAPYGQKTIKLDANSTFYFVNDQLVMDEVQFRMYGLPVLRLQATIVKESAMDELQKLKLFADQ